MTKHDIPDDFTLGLALVDALPVILFGINCLLLGRLFEDRLFMIGAILCLVGGGGKVLWKIIVSLRKKNIWFLFVQMRVLMPAGFLCMLIDLMRAALQGRLGHLAAAAMTLPSLFFLALWLLGMVLMGVFAAKLDNTDVRSNWIEQLTNGAAQACFLAALMFMK